MHCPIAKPFEQKIPEKTVNIMSVIVLDNGCFEDSMKKESGIYKYG